MKSEKRFKSVIDEDTMSVMPYLVSDKEEECFYNLQGCVDLLNEQQATIIHLEKVNGKNFAKRRLLEQDNLVLRNENEQLKQELAELLAVHTKIVETLDSEFVSKALEDGD